MSLTALIFVLRKKVNAATFESLSMSVCDKVYVCPK